MEKSDLILYDLGYLNDYDIADRCLSDIACEDHKYDANETIRLLRDNGLNWEELEEVNGSGSYATITLDIEGAKLLEARARRVRKAPAKKRPAKKKSGNVTTALMFLPAD